MRWDRRGGQRLQHDAAGTPVFILLAGMRERPTVSSNRVGSCSDWAK